MADAPCLLDVALYPILSIFAQRDRSFFAKLTCQRPKCGVFRPVADLQVTTDRFVAAPNADPKPCIWARRPSPLLKGK